MLSSPDLMDGEAASQAADFASFAREHTTDPLYARLAALAAARPAVLALLQAAAPTQRRPTLLLAAIHDRLLALEEAEAGWPPLADYFASLGGHQSPDDGLASAFDDFIAHEATALRATLSTRATQTNEVGRCAALWPALSAIAQRRGGKPLALFDFGCSAGLNLLVDELHLSYRDGAGRAMCEIRPRADAAADVLCQVVSGSPPFEPYRLAERYGVDQAPVPLHDAAAVRWLRACLWPSERERARRFEVALRRARVAGHTVAQADDGIELLEHWLQHLPRDVTPVLLNSWVLAYFTADALASHVDRVHQLMHRHGVVWLSAEDSARALATTGLVMPTAPAGVTGTPTWWTLSEAREAAVEHRLLACSHPHGDWLAWMG